jgi:hypothetical protein
VSREPLNQERLVIHGLNDFVYNVVDGGASKKTTALLIGRRLQTPFKKSYVLRTDA